MNYKKNWSLKYNFDILPTDILDMDDEDDEIMEEIEHDQPVKGIIF